MPAAFAIERDGNIWERNVKAWLRLRYPHGGFVDTPAEHGGDFGVEGFSRDGIAYQCYAAREALKAGELYENQRAKITDDIKKFIERKTALSSLFGELKIKAWWLVVTEHKSAKLIQHAEAKAKEVRDAKLPYTTPDFCVHVAPGYEEFAVEQQAAIRCGIDQLHLPPADIGDDEVADWTGENDTLTNVLEGKLRLLIGEPELTELRSVRDESIKHFRAGANMLNRVRARSPDIWEAINAANGQRKRSVRFRSGTHALKPAEFFEAELAALKQRISVAAPNLHNDNIEEIALGIITEWMIECPLNFREQRRGNA